MVRRTASWRRIILSSLVERHFQRPSVSGKTSLVRAWLRHVATPYPWHLRRMGYARELRWLANRQDRCRAAWHQHLKNTRSLIQRSADGCAGSETVLVVGSGQLFDIPLEQLVQQFTNVVLVDILHPWRAQKAAHLHPNVRLESLDITGVVRDVYHATSSGQGLDVTVGKPEFYLDEPVDLVVSANILSQLPVLPNNYALKRARDPDGGRVASFSRRLVTAHLDWLASFSGRVCLVTDLERMVCDRETVISREPSLWGIELPEGGEEWTWELAPRPEIMWTRDISHRVVGYVEFPKDKWRARSKKSPAGES